MTARWHRPFLMPVVLASVLLTGIARSAGPVDVSQFKDKIRLACVGDSITAGSGAGRGNAYPAQLQRLLGAKWEVGNFGSSGRTLLNAGDNPYQTKGAMAKAMEFKPDVVVIMLGTNDSKPQNWKHKDQFEADLKDLVGKFQKLETKPRIFINTPPYVPGKGNYGINETAVKEELPIIEQVAKEVKATVIDVHAVTDGKEALFPDRVHPNAEGANLLAKTVYQSLTGKAYTGPNVIAPAETKKAPETRKAPAATQAK